MSKELLLKPRLSEKAYGSSEQHNAYVFDVPKNANRHMIAASVAKQYDVEVVSVKIASSPPKPTGSYKKRGSRAASKRSGVRKAYVTLKEGDKLPLFSDVNRDKSESKK